MEKKATKNLFQKLSEASKIIKNVEKGLTVGVGQQGYKAVADADVVKAVNNAEQEVGLVSYVAKAELLKSERVTVEGKFGKAVQYIDDVHIILRIVDCDDPSQFIEVDGFGRGIDPADKGFGKAATYARKYALMNAYKIRTGEDLDAVASVPSQSIISEKETEILDSIELCDTVEQLQKLWHANAAMAASSQLVKTAFTKRKQSIS